MYNFLGTFTTDQLEALFQFIEAHREDLRRRTIRNRAEIQRQGWIYYQEDDDGNVTGYEVQPENSTLMKQIKAFEYFGGDPVELNILDRSEWIYLQKGQIDLDTKFRGGEPSHGGNYTEATSYDDRTPAIYMERLKRPFEDTIKRLENIEYRIKRTVDYADQLIEESVLAANRISGADSIDDLRGRIQQFVSAPDFPSAGTDQQTEEPNDV